MLSPIFESYFSDKARSGNNDTCINLYPEMTDGKITSLQMMPGKKLLGTVGSGPIRGLYVAANGLMYVASGNGFYSVDQFFNASYIGAITTILNVTTPVYIVDSPTQIAVVDGEGCWVWDLIALTFTQVIPNTETDCTGPSIIVYQDGFGLVNSSQSNQIYQSQYNNLALYATPTGLGGYTANNAYIQGNAQYVVTMRELKEEIWIFKQKSIEIWVNAGNPGFAFEKLLGADIPIGCIAPGSVARLGEGLAWIGSDDQGDGVVYLSSGYNAKPITTFALAKAFQAYPIITDAIAYSYQDSGHYFYVLTFPSQNITFAYDLVTGKWTQKATFQNGVFIRDCGNCCAYFNGNNVVGDYDSGNLYALDTNTYTDEYGNPLKWVRSWQAIPPSEPDGFPMEFNSLQIFMETGMTVAEGGNPQIMLEWSNDGGYTWNGPFQVAAGQVGQTTWRVIQHRLGSTTIGGGLERVWRISGTDPLSIKITGADCEYGPS